jgi:uncharacterized Zn-binding protein involved in type VI secretion
MSSSQNLCVYREGTQFKVVTEFTHQSVYESAQAGPAIQTAIDALADGGGQVTLGRGEFPLQAPLRLEDGVTVRGGGRGTKVRLGQAKAAFLGQGVKGAEVRDMALIGQGETGTGVILDACGDSKVRDLFCARMGDYGVWLRNDSFLCEVHGCSVAGSGKAGIFLDHLREGPYGDYVPTMITNCIVYGGGKGIECKDAIVVNIVACAVYQTGDVAYHLHHTSNSVLISGCRSFQITGEAVRVEGTHEFNLSSNIFCWHTGHGVVIEDCYWGTICGNEVIDTGSYNPGGENFQTRFADVQGELPLFNGIELRHVRGYNVTGNTIFNWSVAPPMRYGIVEDEASYDNTISGNTVNYYTGEAVLSQGKNSVVGHNVGYGERPYNDEEGREARMQSFRVELTERFIAEQI